MDGQRNLADYLAMLRRRFLFILLPAVLIGGGAVVVALLLPPSYQATATILVESQQIRNDLASSTVTANADERIQTIKQRLLTRENLLSIADKFDLYAYAGTARTPATIVDNLRDTITIEQIATDVTPARRDVGIIGFSVAFTYRDATIASRVANELVASILSQNIETRLSSASDTTSFFTKQQERIEKSLLEQEAKIAEFKRVNDADLPETMPARRLQATLLSERIATIDSQLRLGNIPVSTNDAGIEQLGFTLRAKQLELEGLVRERDKVAPLAQDGYVAKNRLDDLDQSIALAQLNIESVTAQIAAAGGVVGDDRTGTLTAQRDELEAQLKGIAESISRTPGVEVTLNAMMRDYESLQNEYVQVKTKLQEATVGELLEEDRQSERFEVIEQATVPEQPVEPNRPRIVMVGSFGGLAAGIALGLLLEIANKNIYSARDLERTLGLRPIVAIPYVTTTGETWRRNTQRVLLLVISASVLGVALLVVHVYVTPIDLLSDRVVAFARRAFTSQFGA